MNRYWRQNIELEKEASLEPFHVGSGGSVKERERERARNLPRHGIKQEGKKKNC